MPNWRKVIVSGSDAYLNSVSTPADVVNDFTASWAVNANTASIAISSSWASTSSFAVTSSYAISASYSATASYWSGSIPIELPELWQHPATLTGSQYIVKANHNGLLIGPLGFTNNIDVQTGATLVII